MEIKNMFTIPIYHIEIKNWVRKKEKINNIIKDLYLCQPIEDRSHCLTDYFLNGNGVEPYWNPLLDILGEEIVGAEKSFFDGREILIEGFWVEKSEKNKLHPIHNHGALGYSAIIYVDYDPEVHSATRFVAPFNNFETGATNYYMPNIKEGSMIIFPSCILHEAPLNISDKTRTIISFNFKV